MTETTDTRLRRNPRSLPDFPFVTWHFGKLLPSIRRYAAELDRNRGGQVDSNKDGTFDRSEVHRLLVRLLPHATAKQLVYMGVMIAPLNEGEVAKSEMVGILRSCVQAERAVESGAARHEVAALLQFLRHNLATLSRLLRDRPRGFSAPVTLPQAAALLYDLMPGLTPWDVRVVMAMLWWADPAGLAELSVKALYQTLMLVDVQMAEVRKEVEVAVVHEDLPQKPKWQLEQLSYLNREYVVDKAEARVYEPHGAGWMKLVGTLAGDGTVEPLATPHEVFSAMDRLWREQPHKLKQAFASVSVGKADMRISSVELSRLVKKLLPEATSSQLRIMRDVLDLGSDTGLVTMEEAASAFKEAAEALLDMRSTHLYEAMHVLNPIATAVHRALHKVKDEFARLEADGDGKVDAKELAGVVQANCADITSHEMKHLLLALNEIDAVQDGVHRYGDLLQVLRLVDMVVGKGPAQSHRATWVLEHYPQGAPSGSALVMCPFTQRLYAAPLDNKTWPACVGGVDHQGAVQMVPRTYLFELLDTFFATNQHQLQAAFLDADLSKMGVLEPKQLVEFVCRAYHPGLTPDQAKYVEAMIELDSVGSTFSDLQAMLKQCKVVESVVQQASQVEVPMGLRRVAAAVTATGGAATMFATRAAAAAAAAASAGQPAGQLDRRHMLRLVHDLLPSISPREARFMLVALFEVTPPGTHSFRFRDLQQALRLLAVKVRARSDPPPREKSWWAHTRGGKAPGFKQPT